MEGRIGGGEALLIGAGVVLVEDAVLVAVLRRRAPVRLGIAGRDAGDVGARVVVIEDVITTGGSALRAVDAVRAAGGIVVGVLAVVDREEGGREAIEAASVEVETLARAAEIVARM